MIEPQFRRICGFHSEESGNSAAVWLAHDKDSDVVQLYDACLFKREVFPVIAEGLNARGRWIPVAWSKSGKSMADELLNRGCNILYDPAIDTPAVAEVVSRELWERMRSGRFKVDKRLKNWQEEYKSFFKEDSQVPVEKFPLMAATRHAISELKYAKRQAVPRTTTGNAPKVAII